MSKYGNFNVKVPTYQEELAVINDLEEKGLIDVKEASKKRSKIAKRKLLFIVATNGGYTLGKRKRQKQNLSEHKDIMQAQHTKRLKDELLKEEDSSNETPPS